MLLQYSVDAGQAKKDLDYEDVGEVLIVILMVESPDAFVRYDSVSDRNTHRFVKMVADSGLSYPAKAMMIYVQLDKCLRQFHAGGNAESEDGSPDRLQLWLSMIADSNDPRVAEAAREDATLTEIRTEIYNMSQDKEVQNMIIQERYNRMDWLTYGNQQRREINKAY